VIDQAFDRVARVIEVMLALAFIFAVLLNFANVVGRYLLGLSLLGADEVQIFIMVAMTFLGAAVVTRRNLHLRMDVLVRFLPAPVRVALRVAEQVLLAVLAGFVLTQSYFYARQMWRIGRTSDMAGISGAPATWPASPCGFPTPPSRSASVSSSSSRFAALSA